MENLFPQHTNKTTDLLQLNQIKQHGRSLAEFVSNIKQECAKRREHFNQDELQRAAVSVFISGLDNELFRKVVKQQQPSNINSACELIRNLKPEDNSNVFKLAVEDGLNCSHCNQEIKHLSSKVDYLQKLIVDLQRSILKGSIANENSFKRSANVQHQRFSSNQHQRSPNYNYQRPYNDQKRQIKCYNCGKLGHLQRNCRRR